jgi:hypothetical protein
LSLDDLTEEEEGEEGKGEEEGEGVSGQEDIFEEESKLDRGKNEIRSDLFL